MIYYFHRQFYIFDRYTLHHGTLDGRSFFWFPSYIIPVRYFRGSTFLCKWWLSNSCQLNTYPVHGRFSSRMRFAHTLSVILWWKFCYNCIACMFVRIASQSIVCHPEEYSSILEINVTGCHQHNGSCVYHSVKSLDVGISGPRLHRQESGMI